MDVSSVLNGFMDAQAALGYIVAGLLSFSVLIYAHGAVLKYLDMTSEVDRYSPPENYYSLGELSEIEADGMAWDNGLSQFANEVATEKNLTYEQSQALDDVVARDYEEALVMDEAHDAASSAQGGVSEYSSVVAGEHGYLGLSAQELDQEVARDYEDAVAMNNVDVDVVQVSEVLDVRDSADPADVGYHNEDDYIYDYATGRYYPAHA